MNFQNVQFIRSVASVDDAPRDGLPQVVFAGRSNVGKSSVINRILGRKNLARVSAMPGKTVQLNFFLIDKKLYFVDIPGYGYAKVSEQERKRWGTLIERYLADPDCMTLAVLIVDARHAPTKDDCLMANWFLQSGRPLIVVANKLDKLKASEIEPNCARVREVLALPDEVCVIPFSAEKGTGRDELVRCLLQGAGVSP